MVDESEELAGSAPSGVLDMSSVWLGSRSGTTICAEMTPACTDELINNLGSFDDRVRTRPRGRRCLRDADRRARPGWRFAAVSGGGPRRPGGQGLVRAGLGPAGGQRLHPGAAAGRAVPVAGAHR